MLNFIYLFYIVGKNMIFTCSKIRKIIFRKSARKLPALKIRSDGTVKYRVGSIGGFGVGETWVIFLMYLSVIYINILVGVGAGWGREIFREISGNYSSCSLDAGGKETSIYFPNTSLSLPFFPLYILFVSFLLHHI